MKNLPIVFAKVDHVFDKIFSLSCRPRKKFLKLTDSNIVFFKGIQSKLILSTAEHFRTVRVVQYGRLYYGASCHDNGKQIIGLRDFLAWFLSGNCLIYLRGSIYIDCLIDP